MTLPEWWTPYDTALLVVLVVFIIVAIVLTWRANRSTEKRRRELREAIRRARL